MVSRHKSVKNTDFDPSGLPLVPYEQVASEATQLAKDFPDLDERTAALCIAIVHTNCTIAAAADQIGQNRSWAYTALRRPESQRFMAQLATASLGAAASAAISTLQSLTGSSSEAMRFKAAQALMDRAGLGHSSHGAAGSRSFAFSFGTITKE